MKFGTFFLKPSRQRRGGGKFISRDGHLCKPLSETIEPTIESLERELSAQKAIVQQLTSTIVYLQEALKEEKEMSEKMKKKINQFQTELEKEKINLDKSESSDSPPLMKN